MPERAVAAQEPGGSHEGGWGGGRGCGCGWRGGDTDTFGQQGRRIAESGQKRAVPLAMLAAVLPVQVLRSRLYDMEMHKRSREVDSVRQAAVGTAERNERIRTYNYQQVRRRTMLAVLRHRSKSSNTVPAYSEYLEGGRGLGPDGPAAHLVALIRSTLWHSSHKYASLNFYTAPATDLSGTCPRPLPPSRPSSGRVAANVRPCVMDTSPP